MDSFKLPLWGRPDGSASDDEDLPAIDFVFEDGVIRTPSIQSHGGRTKIIALRELVDQQVQGCGDPFALKAAIQALINSVGGVLPHFEQTAERHPEHADECRRSIAAYTNARDALQHMLEWFNDQSRIAPLTQGLAWLESAVADVDALVAEEQARVGQEEAP